MAEKHESVPPPLIVRIMEKLVVDQNLYLASQSPRRQELLEQIGVRFELLKVSVPEKRRPEEAPSDYVSRLSKEKALAGALIKPECWVMGADTIVVSGGQVLEKPADKDDFLSMFATLSGGIHSVFTSVALCRKSGQSDNVYQQSCETKVQFREIDEAEAIRYWETGEPLDKAGGYGIQGFGAVFVERIEGSYSNVVGLPLQESAKLLVVAGVPIWSV